ncbi:peroxiredoxin [Blastopirellula marina]|uniref:Peroxiredoxin n=1 Tax=Blastopirellula marina TaxID=124 RepID=A0A2S8F7R6_9BACT|nr:MULTISPECIES: OsmC family protein [Pirellulaceae]PQO27964.1 peroxiredoxin [Blastopirellula marina]RCS48389.1 OsmC family peroxiredoxin [Bremerella cremea]
MENFSAMVHWERGDQNFLDKKYRRSHEWRFDGGAVIGASSSPHFLPPPMSDPRGVDPEEALVAAISSCHMLWFLAMAAKHGWLVDSYDDQPNGKMDKNSAGKTAVSLVTLRPKVVFGGENLPNSDEIDAMHHQAHELCFVANSVRSEIRIEPRA